MSIIWSGIVTISVLFSWAAGRGTEVAAAVMEGAGSAVRLCLSMTGVLCMWMGILKVMQRSGLSRQLSRLLRPLLRRLYPDFAGDQETMDCIAANMSANLLGLGNAATPPGVRAACRMSRRTPGTASNALCTLVVCNSASVQLFPTTVAGVRFAAGCADPFDILPAVWLASALSVTAGIAAVRVMGRRWR